MSASARTLLASVEEERASTGDAIERAMAAHRRGARQERWLRHRSECLAYAIGAVGVASVLLEEQADRAQRGTQRKLLRARAAALDSLFQMLRADFAPMILADEEMELRP